MKRYVLAFLIPVSVVTLGFALSGVYPFGSRSALIVDGVHQYMAFYEEFAKMIRSSKGLLYSNHALGYNFFNLFAYYLASPFSLLVLLLRNFFYISEALTLVIVIKIGFCSVSMCWYLSGKKVPPASGGGRAIAACIPVAAGTMYALSDYVIGYYTNLMWLDAVIMLPVLAYAIERMVKCGKWKMYSLVLAYCIITNYYTGYMLCVFSVVYFVSLIIREGRKNETGRGIVRFAGASFLGGALSSVIWVPSIFALAQTSAGKRLNLDLAGFTCGNIAKQAARLFHSSTAFASSGKQGAVNLYCGSCICLFFLLYLRNRSISRKAKLSGILLLAFYFFGFYFRPLNLFLHGFHKPIGMPNRFSFIFIFLVLIFCAEAMLGLKEYCAKDILACTGLAAALVCLVSGLSGNWKVGTTFGWMIVCSLLALCCCIKRINRSFFVILLSLFLVADVGSHALTGLKHVGTANRELYLERKKEIKGLLKSFPDAEKFRTVLTSPRIRNEELLYQINGMSQYSSTNQADMQVFIHKIGGDTGKNRYQYTGTSEVVDMLFGVKYFVDDKKNAVKRFYRKVAESRNFILYENHRAISPGNPAETLIKNIRLKGRNPFAVHEEILSRLGCGRLYSIRRAEGTRHTASKWRFRFSVPLKAGEHGYLCLLGKEPVHVWINGKVHHKKYSNNNFLDLGYAAKDTVIQVYTDSEASHQKAILGTYQEQALDRIYRKLCSRQVT
ncbi:MAG: YfhO family protein [Eubacteriales bacterium]|nr:YfhO family protein [Eubacteriales bacterium]